MICFSSLQPATKNHSINLNNHGSRTVQKLAKMARREPSPVVPALMVGVLSMVIFWPYIYFVVEGVGPLFQGGADAGDTGSSINFLMQLLLVSLTFIIHFLTASSPKASSARKLQSSRSTYGYNEGEGFGLGTLLLVLLFVILYKLM